MYSIVLMAALSTSATEPGCHFRNRCACTGYSACAGCYGGGYGACYGSGYGACYGSGYGACYGSGYGGCYGGCSGYGPAISYGCYGGCYGSSNYAPAYIAPAPPGPKPEVVPPPKTKPAVPKEETSLNDQARLIVEVPADAKLYIDNHPMKTAAAKRVFRTPKLNPAQTYYYDVRVEVVRDGKTVSRTQRVILRAGEEVRAAFADLPTPTKADATASAAR